MRGKTVLINMVDPLTIIRTTLRIALESNRPPDMREVRVMWEAAEKLRGLLVEARK